MIFPTSTWAARLAAGERPALARALSLAERDPAAASQLVAHLADQLGRAQVVGITGPPGAGKSTLVGTLARRFLEMGRSVAVLAVDPSSPLTGGALLGDRFRMGESASDERCFIRSTATRGCLGGLTEAAGQMVNLMDAAGFDLVLVETVGTGQAEVAVAGLTDLTLVVFPPGLGDELQAIKAGILELADLVIVTKSDTTGAQAARQALQSVAPLWRHSPPIHMVSAWTGDGIDALADAVLAQRANSRAAARGASSRQLKAPSSLILEFESLGTRMIGHLSFDPQTCLSVKITERQQHACKSALDVVYRVKDGGDLFQLGAVAGALAVLAAQEGLKCEVLERDLTAGSMQLQLERTTQPAQ